MSFFHNKTYWLVGASEGLGRALAMQLGEKGASLILSARNETRLNELQRDVPSARVVPLDVTDLQAVREATSQIGKVDGIIYCVGAYDPMKAADWNTDIVLRICDANFGGALRLLGETVPKMVHDGQGDITLIGSLAGYRGLPAAIGYGASKSALISLAETMRHDLSHTVVTVRIVNPGFIKTRLTDKNSFTMPQLMSPEKAAAKVLRAMRSKRFRTDFPVPFAWLFKIMKFLPDWLVYRGR